VPPDSVGWEGIVREGGKVICSSGARKVNGIHSKGANRAGGKREYRGGPEIDKGGGLYALAFQGANY